MRRLTQTAFELLYSRLAWMYDAVAFVASLGEWKKWGACALPFLEDGVLELAHGPGHLHRILVQQFEHVVGIDLSRQMGGLARRQLENLASYGNGLVRAGSPGSADPSIPIPESRLACANAMQLPFANGEFFCAVATFPAPFIFEPLTLDEIRRVLCAHGRLVIVPGATFVAAGLIGRLMGVVYRVTGQGSADLASVARRLASHGFHLTEHHQRTRFADVTVWVCDRC